MDRNVDKRVEGVEVNSRVYIVMAFIIGLLIPLTVIAFQGVPEEDYWDDATPVGGTITGFEAWSGHSTAHIREWVKGSMADVDAAVDSFVVYRQATYGENWEVYGGHCGNRTLQRVR